MLSGSTIKWKTIAGFSEYEISNTGSIRRSIYLNHKGKPGRRSKPGALIKTTIGSAGYQCVTLKSDNGGIKWLNVHKLVAENFIGIKPFEKARVLHKDDNKTNNNVSNLYWGTDRQNRLDALRNGRVKRPANHLFSDKQVAEIRKWAKGGMTGAAIARKLLTSEGVISKIVNNIYYKLPSDYEGVA